MEQRNIIGWSEHSDYRELTIPSGEIWMNESELVELFGVFIPKLKQFVINYEDSVRRRYEMMQDAALRDSIGRLMIRQSQDIKKKLKK